ncbi:unnamed protein product [Dovyalis caffra]|uniref:Uncharacterized protein n=1 Tax=Dovyalis caffra TaxID=77055 RepID=A0AAV1SBL9_9ROSI|nr:unnamed protein product [Dovyalis caffra]
MARNLKSCEAIRIEEEIGKKKKKFRQIIISLFDLPESSSLGRRGRSTQPVRSIGQSFDNIPLQSRANFSTLR